jgi:HK97 family phage prohead protease
MLVKKQLDLPEPDADESEEEFIDRCVDEVLADDPEADEDAVVEACQIAWDENSDRSARKVVHKIRTGAKTDEGMEFILSDATPDRFDDVIDPNGWVITQFKRNPIALFNHHSDSPIGTWKNVRVEGNALRGELVFAPRGVPRIDELRLLVEANVLKAVSVGFRPLEMKDREESKRGGLLFTKTELLETSLVAIGANPNALAVAKSLKISPATLNLVFAKHGNRDGMRRRRRFTGGHADTSRIGKGSAMSLAQRIIDLQAQITAKTEELEDHLSKMDDANVSDADMEKTKLLNSVLTQLRNQHAALVESEKNLAKTSDDGSATTRRSLVPSIKLHPDRRVSDDGGEPIIVPGRKKEWDPVDYLVKAGTVAVAAKIWGQLPEVARQRIAEYYPEYNNDEIKVVLEWTQRAASAPAMTTVTGWAIELVQQIYTDVLSLLMAKSIFPRLSAKGLSLNFGRAGKIVLPSRSRTPTIAGSFVGEGMAIPVRQGAFTSVTFTPKKMAVITTWTREMGEHSTPAMEGVLREAIQEDTAVALDSVLLDANPATSIRPAGLLNGVAPVGATAGGGIVAVVGDIKGLVGALVTSTLGNIRVPALLMNPSDVLSASLVNVNGIFPFKEEVGRGTLNNLPIIDSGTVTPKTVILIDAADFVTMGGDSIRFDVSDQATLHMEDTNPADLVSGSPGVVATPQRSLFQTDSLALRMIMPLNWSMRRTGMVAWTQNVTW